MFKDIPKKVVFKTKQTLLQFLEKQKDRTVILECLENLKLFIMTKMKSFTTKAQ